MSAITTGAPNIDFPPATALPARSNVFISENIAIPGSINDLDSYRKWAISDDYPQSGWVSYLDGVITVDPSMEELFTHNQVKNAFAVAITVLLGPSPAGMFVADRMLLSCPAANLCTEPDGLFFFWQTVKSGRLQFIEGTDGIIELLGTPDMTLEVVSKNSVGKDSKRLRELYWKAGILEYWLVDTTVQQEGPHKVLGLVNAAWRATSGVTNRYYSIASSRLGHALIAGSAASGWSTLTQGQVLGTYTLVNGQPVYQSLNWFEAWGPVLSANYAVTDLSLGQIAPQNQTNLTSVAWAYDAMRYPVAAVTLYLSPAEVQFTRVLHWKLPGQPEMMTQYGSSPWLSGSAAATGTL